MEQFEQLLTCAICLDRYRNPKLLPCQHSFCMEPCMDGLVDYVRRQVKCPECRAEHRIPYQGVQGYPTNVTLQRFLELHIEITGELPDPTSGQVMKRCSVCSEKSYVAMCGHCDKEVCADCKGAHMDILRREIARINSQVRRALHRLQDMLALVERNMLALQTNCHSVSEEVEEIHNRLTKALKDRTEFLQGELDRYLSTELKNLSQLKDNLELEISNISSNCDLADEHMANENVEWDDLELMDAKEIFLRTVEFIRNFETETTDYTRRVRFVMSHDPNTLVLNVAGYGELSINMPHPVIQSLQPPGPGLMRSKSDHRLASQYRGEDRGYDRSPYDTDPMQGRVSPLGGRKFGERPRDRVDLNSGSRYGGRNDRDYGDEYDPEGRQTARSRIRARFRHGAGDADSDSETHGGRSVRFNEPHGPPAKEREKVLDTEDVAKGPLSGITRLLDSPRVMKKLLESEIKKTKKENEPAPPPPAQNKAPIIRKTSGTNASAPVTQRQVSEDDEIARIKKQNKNVASSSETATREPVRPSSERVAALKQQSSADQRTPERSPSRRPSTVEVTSSEADSDEEVAAIGSLRKTSTTASPPGNKPASRRVSTEVGGNRPSTTTATTATPAKSTPPATKEEEEEDDDDEEETEEETETSSESEETESEEEAAVKKPASGMEKTDIGPLLARSANARDTAPAATSTSGSSARDAFIASRYNTSSDSRDSSSYKPFGSKDETSTTTGSGEKDGAALSSWARYLKSKYGNRGKEGAGPSSSGTASGTSTPSRRSSLHSRHGDESDDESKNMYGSPNDPIQTTAQAAQTGIGQVGTTPRSQYLQKRRLQFKIGSRGSEPGCFTWPRGIAVGPDNSIVVADSSNHRVQVFDSDGIFTKEFGSYGNAEGEFDCLAGVAVNRIGQFIIADRYNHRIQPDDDASTTKRQNSLPTFANDLEDSTDGNTQFDHIRQKGPSSENTNISSESNVSERRKQLIKQLSMPESILQNPIRTANNISQLEGNDLLDNRRNIHSASSQINEGSSPRRAQKYNRTKPPNRQNSMPEFATRTSLGITSSPRTEQKYQNQISPILQTNTNPFNSNEENNSRHIIRKYTRSKPPDRQNSMPEFTSIPSLEHTVSPREKYLNQISPNSQVNTRPSQNDTQGNRSSEDNFRQNNTLPSNHLNPENRGPKKFVRQKTIPEFTSTTSRSDDYMPKNKAPSNFLKDQSYSNDPLMSPNTSSPYCQLNPMSETKTKANPMNFTVDSKSTHHGHSATLKDNISITNPHSHYGSTISPTTPKPFRRQHSMPETKFTPIPNKHTDSVITVEETPTTISGDIESRKQKYENDNLDMNKRMRRQKADSRVKGMETRDWKPRADTKPFNPYVPPRPNMQSMTLSSRPSTSAESTTPLSVLTNKPRPINKSSEVGSNTPASVSRKPTPSSFNRPQTSGNNPSRRYSVDSAIGSTSNPVASNTPVPPKSNNWQDEARNQVWRNHMQRIKNLDGF